MQKFYLIFYFFWGIYIAGCASNRLETYLSFHPNLSPELFVAVKDGNVINGMNKEHVQLILGEPDFIEQKSPEKNTLEKWIYRFQKKIQFDRGKKIMEEYDLESSSFPQGIGHIIPMNYNAKEIRIEFEEAQVCKIQKIIAF